MFTMRRAFTNIGRAAICAETGPFHAIANATIVEEDGRIVAIGSQIPISDCAEVHECGGRLATPGFVDAHTHLIFGGDRSEEFESRCTGATYEEIAAKGGGILSTVDKTRSSTLESLVESGLKRVRWAMSSGTTAFECKTGYGLDEGSELRMLTAIGEVARGLKVEIVPTLLGLHAIPPEFSGRKREYVDWVCRHLVPKAKGLGAKFADAFIEKGYFDGDDARKLADSAFQCGMSVRLHVDQLADGGGASIAAKVGAVTADHLEHTSDAGIMALKEAGTIPVLLPASVFSLGKSKYPDARKMIDQGLKVVLATDFNPGSSPSISMPFVLSLACTQMGMSPSEALVASTMHAATAVGLAADHGSLEVGKLANFVIWDLDHEREIPYWIAAPIVKKTLIAGEVRFGT